MWPRLRRSFERRVTRPWRLWSCTHLWRADVVMLGDSLTFEGFWDEYFPRAHPINLGVGGNTTQDVIGRLDAVCRLRPLRLFLLIGVNDLDAGLAPETVVSNCSAILESLKRRLPQTRVFVQSLLPVGHGWPKARNEDVVRVNAGLKALAERQGMPFVDLHRHFSDERGELRSSLSRDGLHLSSAGYEVWSSILSPLLTTSSGG